MNDAHPVAQPFRDFQHVSGKEDRAPLSAWSRISSLKRWADLGSSPPWVRQNKAPGRGEVPRLRPVSAAYRGKNSESSPHCSSRPNIAK